MSICRQSILYHHNTFIHTAMASLRPLLFHTPAAKQKNLQAGDFSFLVNFIYLINGNQKLISAYSYFWLFWLNYSHLFFFCKPQFRFISGVFFFFFISYKLCMNGYFLLVSLYIPHIYRDFPWLLLVREVLFVIYVFDVFLNTGK